METLVKLSKVAVKQLLKAPWFIRAKLATWQAMVTEEGLEATRQLPGLHDEPLKGKRQGQRSIRLNRQWRAIYTVQQETVCIVTIEEVTPHDYR